MTTSYSMAPHAEGPAHPASKTPVNAPNAGLLIDFDNVTMGMRSDLSKELKTLLSSDIIRGKVTVQRAYADWRRYPQYIVPLSEASIDLIFAPAYGSSKKNATDIRMAIDGMELVFTRPEIGTYILLTGDSDFSSLVLKLKEYGKYVIGVGIQESSSDILVQNCDEYYSYTSLSGLRKTGEDGVPAQDPWVLVEKAVEQMSRRNDVMRSDRLKQVMLELDSGFDEKSYGFSKFSRFITEAAQKGLLRLKKLENGQYEIDPVGGDGGEGRSRDSRSREPRGREEKERRPSSGRSGGRSQERETTRSQPSPSTPSAPGAENGGRSPQSREALKPAYDLMLEALDDLLDEQESDAVRDSDVKRRMLAIQSGFDEAEMGFAKFSHFLRQAHDHEVIDLRKTEAGNYEIALPKGAPSARTRDSAPAQRSAPSRESGRTQESTPEEKAPAPKASRGESPAQRDSAARLRPRMTGRRRSSADEPPPLLEGQAIQVGASSSAKKSASAPSERKGSPAPSGRRDSPTPSEPRESPATSVDVEALRLPTDPDAVIKYLSNSYKGVGQKTAETLVEELGRDLFPTLQENPRKIKDLLPPARAEKVLEGWATDFQRRSSRLGKGSSPQTPPRDEAPSREPSAEVEPSVSEESPVPEAEPPAGRRLGRGGRRTRGGRGSR